jgi:hypothetical protein
MVTLSLVAVVGTFFLLAACATIRFPCDLALTEPQPVESQLKLRNPVKNVTAFKNL